MEVKPRILLEEVGEDRHYDLDDEGARHQAGDDQPALLLKEPLPEPPVRVPPHDPPRPKGT